MGLQLLLDKCRSLSDSELMGRLQELSRAERANVVKILAGLVEMTRRDLALKAGYSSLFKFCVEALGFCKATSYYRSKAALACLRFPRLLEELETGALGVKALARLSDHLTEDNYAEILAKARNADADSIEKIIATLKPEVRPRETTRLIAIAPAYGPPTSQGNDTFRLEAPPPEPTIVTEHRFTFNESSEAKLVKARELLRHKYPIGSVEQIFDAALDSLLTALEARTMPPKPRADKPPRLDESPRVPLWVKRKVRKRDGDRCAYVSPDGRRCEERGFLQYDHIKPWALGGSSDDPDNIRQACGSHNRWSARQEGLFPPVS